ncbi:hypothetical protein [Dongia sp.]|uniref:hypothetical protein n=1 Tax=Dongia sp. TaxID=1977262 RepID=UPI0037521EF8
MREAKNIQTKTKLAIVAVVAIGLLGIAAPLALADGVGAPTSAAGGVGKPSSPSRPGAVGPQGGTNGSSARSGSGSSSYDYEPLKLAPPSTGTGKFDDPKSPCIGTTGFGSSSAQPGHGC